MTVYMAREHRQGGWFFQLTVSQSTHNGAPGTADFIASYERSTLLDGLGDPCWNM